MNDQLNLSELKLLWVIDESCNETNEVERDHLSVVARGKGLELGQGLRRLQALGLIKEFRRQPNFLLRRIGVLPTDFILLTHEGRSTARKVEPIRRRKPLASGQV